MSATDDAAKELLKEITEKLLSPRARRTQSTNFLLAAMIGVSAALAASALVSAATIYFQSEGAILGNPAFVANAILTVLGTGFSSSFYRRYKTLNEVQDFAEKRGTYSSKLRPYDLLQKLGSQLRASELEKMGHTITVNPILQEMKGVRAGTLVIKRGDYVIFTKEVARILLEEKSLMISHALDSEGDTALQVIEAKLSELEKSGDISVSWQT